jgi:alkylation response protein AidB-like acyl-CoA dehydrogenase
MAHPREFIHENVAERLRSFGSDAERLKNLHAGQLSVIHEENWLNMYVPRNFGGAGLSLLDILRIEEGVAWADGSSGWVVTLCSGAAWFVGFLDPILAIEIFQSENVCFAGSGAINGIAERSSKGYEINGSWPYATGSLLATVFTVNCLIFENGIQLCGPDGKPLVKSFLLMAEEVRIHRTWSAMGMIATGSHSIEVRNIIVPDNRCFTIDPEYAVLPDAIFAYPFQQLAECTLTINLSGLACRFLDLAEQKLRGKSNGRYDPLIAEERLKLDNARQKFYHVADLSWNHLWATGQVSEETLRRVTVMSGELAERCAEVVFRLYPFCGLEAADMLKEINRVWRNFQTAIQHTIFHKFRMDSRDATLF